MSLRDYAHHNEDAVAVWWEEEGRHPHEPEFDERGDFYDRDSYIDDDDFEE